MEIPVVNVNSVDPGQMLHSMVFDQTSMARTSLRQVSRQNGNDLGMFQSSIK